MQHSVLTVPGFLPLGRHCDKNRTGLSRSAIYVPGFLPLGRHCDTASFSGESPNCSVRPRISAPGQALRRLS